MSLHCHGWHAPPGQSRDCCAQLEQARKKKAAEVESRRGIALLDNRREMSFSIGLARIKKTKEEVGQAIRDLDCKLFSSSDLEILQVTRLLLLLVLLLLSLAVCR